MKRIELIIEDIPSILWGDESDKLMIAVHGKQSHKADTVIELVAQVAVQNHYQVLSFDLPEHGERKEEHRLCDAENCVYDLLQIINYAHTISNHISMFGCSMGAYYSMLAYQDEAIQHALFLSPVVDMRRLIDNIMTWFDVSEEQLEQEKEVKTAINTLYWHDYQYVVAHPIQWDKPTALLYGAKDELCEYEYVTSFAEACHADMTILEGSEHYFHTEQQLDFFQEWLNQHI